jgi:hypothetical protein
VDALAPTGDEGRGKLRKAPGSRKQALIRGYPNGETHPDELGIRPAESIGGCERTRGSEPSQYPEENKSTEIPKVAASEIGTAQTAVLAWRGCRTA